MTNNIEEDVTSINNIIDKALTRIDDNLRYESPEDKKEK